MSSSNAHSGREVDPSGNGAEIDAVWGGPIPETDFELGSPFFGVSSVPGML